ncbi:hypothetical protein M0R45_024718 [Rubus argutus]|uniref:Uncharacterized protein n=1 Tax=Rubus argutus TaxID=59490 RepID=A0AAW1WTB4_RUBAR
MGGCDNNGNLHEEKFSAPMPWIGMYVAAASFACLIAMAADVILGFRHRKLWFPSNFFSINATSLTLLGVAIKLSVDLNTPMPNSHDQLAKLSSSVFICTAMANSMPSLGAMENEEMFMNVIALGILVITLIVNICMQLATRCHICVLEGACFDHVHHARSTHHVDFLCSNCANHKELLRKEVQEEVPNDFERGRKSTKGGWET